MSLQIRHPAFIAVNVTSGALLTIFFGRSELVLPVIVLSVGLTS
jgi:hypothetical protein